MRQTRQVWRLRTTTPACGELLSGTVGRRLVTWACKGSLTVGTVGSCCCHVGLLWPLSGSGPAQICRHPSRRARGCTTRQLASCWRCGPVLASAAPTSLLKDAAGGMAAATRRAGAMHALALGAGGETLKAPCFQRRSRRGRSAQRRPTPTASCLHARSPRQPGACGPLVQWAAAQTCDGTDQLLGADCKHAAGTGAVGACWAWHLLLARLHAGGCAGSTPGAHL